MSRIEPSQRNNMCKLLPVINYQSEEEQLIFNAMKIANNSLYPCGVVLKMYRDEAVKNRTFAIEWMNRVLARESDDARDMSMRIFDLYLTKCYMDKPQILQDTCFISFAAATSIVLGSKLQNFRSPINASSLTAFNTEDVLSNEKDILSAISTRISPLTTPSYYLYYAISLCSDLVRDEEQLIKLATVVIGDFWEDPASLLYAPSTVAVSALIVCLSMLGISCQPFLEKLPEFFFPNGEYKIFTEEEGKSAYLHFHECMAAMERLPSVQSIHHCNSSPTSIAISPMTVHDETHHHGQTKLRVQSPTPYNA